MRFYEGNLTNILIKEMVHVHGFKRINEQIISRQSTWQQFVFRRSSRIITRIADVGLLGSADRAAPENYGFCLMLL
ncbi:5371_t:CDS:2 [Gigaspora margarita]|uniref:5371_t:CDS:1 n=1 Tax=Gigaspora margarita TaxID=4874 RepID=A0ABN7V2S9_GIGMA|nr:5371_t:CDS:2 [Gigaspora margarita]